MVKTRKKVLDKLALQDVKEEVFEEQVIENYKRLMNSYFDQKKLIPKENLIDLKYEDLVSDPIKEVEKIYSKLKFLLTNFFVHRIFLVLIKRYCQEYFLNHLIDLSYLEKNFLLYLYK